MDVLAGNSASRSFLGAALSCPPRRLPNGSFFGSDGPQALEGPRGFRARRRSCRGKGGSPAGSLPGGRWGGNGETAEQETDQYTGWTTSFTSCDLCGRADSL